MADTVENAAVHPAATCQSQVQDQMQGPRRDTTDADSDSNGRARVNTALSRSTRVSHSNFEIWIFKQWTFLNIAVFQPASINDAELYEVRYGLQLIIVNFKPLTGGYCWVMHSKP